MSRKDVWTKPLSLMQYTSDLVMDRASMFQSHLLAEQVFKGGILWYQAYSRRVFTAKSALCD